MLGIGLTEHIIFSAAAKQNIRSRLQDEKDLQRPGRDTKRIRVMCGRDVDDAVNVVEQVNKMALTHSMRPGTHTHTRLRWSII